MLQKLITDTAPLNHGCVQQEIRGGTVRNLRVMGTKPLWSHGPQSVQCRQNKRVKPQIRHYQNLSSGFLTRQQSHRQTVKKTNLRTP